VAEGAENGRTFDPDGLDVWVGPRRMRHVVDLPSLAGGPCTIADIA
jgi:hypothetical protein